MANKQIYELTTRTFDGDCLVPFDTANLDPSTQAEKPYLSSKTSGNSMADFFANEEQFTNDLTTEDKTLTGAINELLVYALNIADEYDSTSTYAVDDFCIYEGVLYKCTTAITVAEAWTPAHWTSTLIVDNFGTGGGASVTLGTTVPSDASGSNGDLYVQYDSTSYAVINYFVKINGSWRVAPYSKVVALTQAQYDLITPDSQTLYIITDAQGSYVKLPVITDAYDSTATYNTGDLCIYSDTLYKCNTDNTTGTWDAQYWDATSIADELGAINTELSGLKMIEVSDTITASLTANNIETVTFTFNVPTGYKIAYFVNTTYSSNFIMDSIRIEDGDGQREVRVNVWSNTTYSSQSLSGRAICFPNIQRA